MCLYSPENQVPFRSKEAGVTFWFSESETEAAIEQILRHYQHGQLPNTTLLLQPVIHERCDDGSFKPLGSGVFWCTSLSLGVDVLRDESIQRVRQLGMLASTFHRGDNDRAGLKILGVSDEMLAPQDTGLPSGCREAYDIANVQSDNYAGSYLLSGLAYLTNHGLFHHPDFNSLVGASPNTTEPLTDLIEQRSISVQKVVDAAYCWNAYQRHHSLYEKFGTNPDDVADNMRFFDMVARDVELFDATGPMRRDADDMFEFIVPGLVPRGSVTLLAGTGGTGKSSLAHLLCVMAATDYPPGQEAPRWLGQRLAIEKCKGISIYFSGEDGPPIINARASIFDPRGRARRLMFQRTDFGEGVTFAQHIRRLSQVPEVPILVVDPARKYLAGDEDNSQAVSDFFEALEEFAITKHCAVVVVHHLQKAAKPTSAADVIDMIRGSQVFIDRSRVIIGMFRDGPYTIAGLAKNNIPPNMGMVTEERVFARDPKRLQLVWLPGHEGVRNANLSAEEIEKIAQAARDEGR
ncbi:MAG: AAA family ATPase [Alphaproteobacteria bacterium]|nr:AAA family ATPase [Alphaproteobacteria bacterium]